MRFETVYALLDFVALQPERRMAKRARVPLSDHSIKAARYTTKYLIGRLLGRYLRKLGFGPTLPNASARAIAPYAPRLSLRDTSIVACIVTIGAFYHTGCEPLSLPL